MRYASLFTGIGGLDRAIDSLGGECAVQVEREPYCLDVLRLRYPDVPKITDVLDFQTSQDRSHLDLVVGGPPCQPVSHAGRRKGTADDRWLWGEALRVVREAQPARVFFENPMGLRTLGLDAILAELSEMGYGGAWEVVAAADVGAPHLRKRIFIMGIRGREGWEGPTRPPGNRGIIWPTPTASDAKSSGAAGYSSPGHHSGTTLTDAVVGARGPKWPSPTASGERPNDYVAAYPAQTWPTPTSRDHKDTGDSIANGTVPVNGLLGRAVGPTRERGSLSPDWVEWLQNLPIGWTDTSVTDPGPVYGWESEPDLPRIGLGIPNRSKRLTALGNACVPAQVVFAWHRLSERLGVE